MAWLTRQAQSLCHGPRGPLVINQPAKSLLRGLSWSLAALAFWSVPVGVALFLGGWAIQDNYWLPGAGTLVLSLGALLIAFAGLLLMVSIVLLGRQIPAPVPGSRRELNE
jgi:hypothetical protein